MKEKWDGMSNEELCLEYQQNKDNNLFEYFLNRNTSLIRYFMKILIRKYPSQADFLMQIGKQAMWDAMLHYDPDKESKFSTMYYWYVLKTMREFYEEQFDIRLPAHVREKLAAFREKHKEDNYVFDTVSLSTPTLNHDSEELLEDIIASDENLEADLEAKATREELIAYARRLSPRSCACVIEYFGLEDGIPKTLQILGDKYGVTRERIRQVISNALKKIKRWYINDHTID